MLLYCQTSDPSFSLCLLLQRPSLVNPFEDEGRLVDCLVYPEAPRHIRAVAVHDLHKLPGREKRGSEQDGVLSLLVHEVSSFEECGRGGKATVYKIQRIRTRRVDLKDISLTRLISYRLE